MVGGRNNIRYASRGWVVVGIALNMVLEDGCGRNNIRKDARR